MKCVKCNVQRQCEDNHCVYLVVGADSLIASAAFLMNNALHRLRFRMDDQDNRRSPMIKNDRGRQMIKNGRGSLLINDHTPRPACSEVGHGAGAGAQVGPGCSQAGHGVGQVGPRHGQVGPGYGPGRGHD